MGEVIEITRQHRVDRDRRLLLDIWENGDVAWSTTIGTRMSAGEFALVDLENLTEMADIEEIGQAKGPDGQPVLRFKVAGLDEEERPVDYEMDVHGRSGVIRRVRWRP